MLQFTSSDKLYSTFACQGHHLFKLKKAETAPSAGTGGPQKIGCGAKLGVFIEPVPEDGDGEMEQSSLKDLPKRSRVSVRKGGGLFFQSQGQS